MKILAVFNGVSETNIPFENFMMVSDLEIDKAVCTFNGVIMSSALGEQTITTTEAQAANKPGNKLSGLFVIAKSTLEYRPDIIHVHHALSGFVASIVGKVFLRSKLIVTIHTDYRHLYWLHKAFIWLNMRMADYVVCNSASTKQSIKNAVPSQYWHKNVTVIYNGVDASRIMSRTECSDGITGSQPVRMLIIGRLVSAKGHDVLLKSISLLKEGGLDVFVDIIGDGILKNSLMDLVRVYKIDYNVRFLGLLGRDDVYARLAGADCLIVSSRWEGFCNAMVEAMFSGVPVIASNLDVLVEVLGKENGLFFESGNADSLADKIRYMTNNYKIILERARQAKQRAFDLYELEKSSSAYAKVYRNVSS
ncbi:glycosyltransferase involved in cell wall biosynthesis [Thiogranum longum]|uniref:Glycosyltransferase involved in cell wall biosynthesis n=1 Tax=Thiogranum longum TaxID=1537524 RepID=A0A4R1HCV6_9GAMM|nr:glycosyltransferase family 4 protein [Thiogranum longum]TCK18105.1 glycosyltransferase involved in cell wall biosynthesis [Thiogranum longum]